MRSLLSWTTRLSLVFCLLGLVGCQHNGSSQGSSRTALDEYVATPDPAYAYNIVNTVAGEGQTTFIVEMTSQNWLTTNEVNRTLWKHWLTIVRPDSVTNHTGFLFITGGNNDKGPPAKADDRLLLTALQTKSVIAEIKMVPNQPLVFVGDGKPRGEDSLIAYGWDKFLRGGDHRWLARLPMTKSAVRAMDTVTAICAQDPAKKLVVDKFVVAGGSKRGWTTWTTAVVDKRVVAIVPIVIDMLNVVPSFMHHYEAYGFYAPAVGDYERMGLMDWNGTPEYDELRKTVEPYEYRDRLTMPKLLINATGDQFFLPDSAQFYFEDLQGVKYLRYVPNADHSLRGSDAWESLVAFYDAILNQRPLPKFTWKVEGDGVIRVKAEDKPQAVKLWQATNPAARDFRLETLGPVWQSSDLKEVEPGVYEVKVPAPAQGWTAFLVELTYPSEGPAPFKFTTEVRVVPDKLPYKYKPNPNPPKGYLSGH